MSALESRLAMLRTGWWSYLLPSQVTTRKFPGSNAWQFCFLLLIWSSVKLLALSQYLQCICPDTCCLIGHRYPFHDLLMFIDSAYSMVLLIAPKDLNPQIGDRLNGAVMQCTDCCSEGQIIRDRCINLSRKCLARHIYEQNLIALNVKMWEKYRENILHIFTLEPRIIDCIIFSLW